MSDLEVIGLTRSYGDTLLNWVEHVDSKLTLEVDRG